MRILALNGILMARREGAQDSGMEAAREILTDLRTSTHARKLV